MTYEELKMMYEKQQKKEIRKKIFKTLLFCTASAAGGYAIGRAIGKAAMKKTLHALEGDKILSTLDNSSKQFAPWTKKIDEDIFTSLAPEIEDAVLNYGLEKFWAERVYELDPVTSKTVTVTIDTVNGD